MNLLQNMRFVLMALFVAAGVGVVWWVRNSGQDIPSVFASSSSLDASQVKESMAQLDGQVANMIRTPSAVNFEGLPFRWPESVTQATNSTVSATFSTTPAEFWQNLREKGAQEALGTVVSQAQVQAGEVSADIVNEARYQYCKGVVTAYESAPKKASP
jgi:hypothetical protein